MATSADDEVRALGQLVASHPAYDDVDWTYIALVATFTKAHRSLFGYVYMRDGRWETTLPRDPQRSVMRAFRTLHTTMERRDGRAWVQCLLEVSRHDGTVAVQFEYDDAGRWAVTPDALARVLDGRRHDRFGTRAAEAS